MISNLYYHCVQKKQTDMFFHFGCFNLNKENPEAISLFVKQKQLQKHNNNIETDNIYVGREFPVQFPDTLF